ncbi:MAG: ABC transporter substrate-binding protein [Spirochaetales bacterium]|nr:ABC transporter substrate-binding protein [Spirochaetales bacterium]
MKRSCAFILLLLCLTGQHLTASGQGAAESSVEMAVQKLFYDGQGQEIPLYGDVERIVVVNSGLSSLLAALEQSEKIVGRDSFSSFPSSVRSKMVVARSSAYPNLELIMSLKPDLVMADAMFDLSTLEKLKALEIPVAIESTSDPAGVRDLLVRYGDLLNCRERADEIINAMDRADRELQEIIAAAQMNGAEPPKVFYENRKTYKSVSSLSSSHQFLDLSGAVNIAADQEVSAPALSPEFILSENPSVIVRRVSGDVSEDTMIQMRDKILRRPGLRNTAAVKDENVYIIKADLFMTVRYPTALSYLASWFYPEAFNGGLSEAGSPSIGNNPEDFNRQWTDFLFGDGAFDSTKEIFTVP